MSGHRSLFREISKDLQSVTDSPDFEAGVIFEEVFGKDWRTKDLKGELSGISFADENKIKKMTKRRLEGEPLQYIVGKWEFYGAEINVKKGALIPRQDTETLVYEALGLIEGITAPKVMDLCSGTGCVPIAIKLKRPDCEVFAVEKYPEAFNVLKENAAKYPGINIVLGDAMDRNLAENFSGFDIITANPPYLDDRDMENLQPEVRSEPKTALYGGSDGLDFYRALPKIWINSLKPGGKIALEFGLGQGEAVKTLLREAGFKNARLKNDLTGRERVAVADK